MTIIKCLHKEAAALTLNHVLSGFAWKCYISSM